MPTKHSFLPSELLPAGRLSISSTDPIPANGTSTSYLYYVPYTGNTIQLYDGSLWNTITFSSISYTIPTVDGASYNYDVWGYSNNGELSLDLTIWTSDTVRATALTLQDGVYVKSGDPTKRYLGTVRLTTSNGVDVLGIASDTSVNRWVWNMYNRVNKICYETQTAAHTYNSSTARLWNNSTTNNQISWVNGLSSLNFIAGSSGIYSSSDGTHATCFLYVDGSSQEFVKNMNAYYITAGTCAYVATEGYHYMNMYESSTSGTAGFRNMSISFSGEF